MHHAAAPVDGLGRRSGRWPDPPSGRCYAGAQRIVRVQTVDLNALFYLRIIGGTDGKRPEETWDARLAWLLGSDYLTGLVEDNGYLTSIDRPMLANDYRGQVPADVLNDLAARTGPDQSPLNYFAFWDPVSLAPTLFFDEADATTFDSTIFISNDPADEDGITTFYPWRDATFVRTPEEVYSEVWLEYAEGTAVFRKNATVGIRLHRARILGIAPVHRSAIDRHRPGRRADRDALDRSRTSITVTIQVPASKVGLIQAGQRVKIKFLHLADLGYDSFTWLRCTECSPKPTDDMGHNYNVDLTLKPSRGLVLGGSGGGTGPADAGAPDTSSVNVYLDVDCHLTATTSCSGYGDVFVNVSLTDDFTGLSVNASNPTAHGSFIAGSTAGNETDSAYGLRLDGGGANHFALDPVDTAGVSLPLNTPIYVWGSYTDCGSGAIYTDGGTTVTSVYSLPAGVSIVVTAASPASGGSGSQLRLCTFELQKASALNPPLSGQPVSVRQSRPATARQRPSRRSRRSERARSRSTSTCSTRPARSRLRTRRPGRSRSPSPRRPASRSPSTTWPPESIEQAIEAPGAILGGPGARSAIRSGGHPRRRATRWRSRAARRPGTRRSEPNILTSPWRRRLYRPRRGRWILRRWSK